MENLKKILTLLFALHFFNNCFAQNNSNKDYEKFVRRFPMTIYYPPELIRSCTPVACLIKFRVDSQKNVIDMKLSDSADSLMKAEFTRHKSNLDIKLLESFIKNEYIANRCDTYVIPLSYSLYRMPCPEQTVKVSSLFNYSKFDGEYLNGNVIFLNPIYLQTAVQR